MHDNRHFFRGSTQPPVILLVWFHVLNKNLLVRKEPRHPTACVLEVANQGWRLQLPSLLLHVSEQLAPPELIRLKIQVLLDSTPIVRLLVPISLAIFLMLLLGFSLTISTTSVTNLGVLMAPECFLRVLRSGLKFSLSSEASYYFARS